MEELIDIALFDDSDDDGDLEDAVVLHILNENLGNRANFYGRFNLEEISNIEAKTYFRFEKEHIPRLCHALGIPNFVRTPDNITVNGKPKYLFF